MRSLRAEYTAVSTVYINWQKYLLARVNLTKDSAIPAVGLPRMSFRERWRGPSPLWMWVYGGWQVTVHPQIAPTLSCNFVWDSWSLCGCFGSDSDCSRKSLLWMLAAQPKSLKGRGSQEWYIFTGMGRGHNSCGARVHNQVPNHGASDTKRGPVKWWPLGSPLETEHMRQKKYVLQRGRCRQENLGGSSCSVCWPWESIGVMKFNKVKVGIFIYLLTYLFIYLFATHAYHNDHYLHIKPLTLPGSFGLLGICVT